MLYNGNGRQDHKDKSRCLHSSYHSSFIICLFVDGKKQVQGLVRSGFPLLKRNETLGLNKISDQPENSIVTFWYSVTMAISRGTRLKGLASLREPLAASTIASRRAYSFRWENACLDPM